MHFLVESCVNSHPDSVALSFEGKDLTYSELNQKANQVARALMQVGVVPGDRVGVCLERSFDLIISLLGVLKAGASYLPLDPEYPVDRLSYMIGHARPSKIIFHKSLSSSLPINPSEQLCYDDFDLNQIDSSNLEIDLLDDSLCYIIYTSGSTGTPKGVSMGHTALSNLIAWQNIQSGSIERPTTLQFTPVSFDVHFQEIFSTLSMGGKLILVSEEERLDSLKLLDKINSEKVQRLFLPFVALNHLSEMVLAYNKVPTSLKEVTTAGEQLKVTEGVRFLFKNLSGARLHNHYGPSETHVVTSYTLEGDSTKWEDLPSIGKPITNVSLFILDESLEECLEGELYFGGSCLAHGYLFQDDLTIESFIESEKYGRLYKTGDLGRLNDQGNINFLGRLDGQVKIRGYRIEVGEIEVLMDKIIGVESSSVKVFEDGDDKFLVGYIVGSIKPLEVKKEIGISLPGYMVPSHIVSLKEMPLTPSGKVDKKALPLPGNERPELNVEYSAPKDETEIIIANLWAMHLKINKVGILDSFFDLGGNSLMALRILAELKEKHGIEISIVKMFQYPTIEGQVASLSGENDSGLSKRLETFKRKQSSTGNRDIAVVAVNGRFPGAQNVEELWQNILNGKNSISKLTKDQLDGSIPEELKNDPNYVSARGIMPEFDKFDASFFGITPREAELMDPQQRVFLELAYESLEKAGYTSDKYDGSIGVFAGMANNTYYQKVLKETDKVNSVGEFNVMLGNEKDYIATRVSHKLNLKGPSISLHTGCSTSLVAIIQAVQSLRAGECDMALAGGISIQGAPYSGYLYQEGGIFSKDGLCRPFDNEATGTVFNDGGAIVVLKLLSEAEKDSDEILGVIKGVAINNDGADKMSFTAPSVLGQAEVIARAQIDAGINSNQVGYIEAHGTATPVGDPVEVEGLCKAFGETDENQFCFLGSIKSNIGHLTSAAGVTGFIKSLLVVKTGKVPGTLHYKKANQSIDFESTPFKVRSTTENYSLEGRRIAAVSSFGVGGTNAHLIVEEYVGKDKAALAQDVYLYKISAKSEEALEELTIRQLAFINNLSSEDKTKAAFTLDLGRADYSFRRFFVGTNERIDKLNTQNSSKHKFKKRRPLIFMFPGQGSQYINMGQGLMKYPVFKESFDKCCSILKEVLDKDLREVIFPTDHSDDSTSEALKNTYYTQPAIFSFEYSLANLLMSFGITPDAFVGHSVGEFVAATLSGIFTLEEGLKLIAKRGELMRELPGGSMLSVRLDESKITPYLNNQVQLAAINAPGLCVVAGPTASIKLFQESLEKQDIVCRFLHTSHAFHSAMMDPIVSEYQDFVEKIDIKEAQIPVFSTVKNGANLSDPSYWAKHLRATVRFSPCIEELVESEDAVYLEIGPRNTLTSLSKKVFLEKGKKDLVSIQTISDSPEMEDLFLHKALGQLWLQGIETDKNLYYGDMNPGRIALETMPFKRKRIWIDQTTNYIEQIEDKETKMTASNNDGLKSKLTEVFEEASGMDISEFEIDTSFMEMGMDSLFLTQVALNLKKEFKVEISFRQLMEELATTNELCEFLGENSPLNFESEVIQAVPVAAPPVQAAVGAPVQVAAAPQVASPVQQAQPVQLSTGSNLETIVAKQLDLMAQQIGLLSGQGVQAPAVQVIANAPVPIEAPVVAPQTQEPAALERKSSNKKVGVDNAKKAFGAIARINTKKNSELTASQVSYIDQLTSEYNKKTIGSKNFTQKYRKSHADPRVVTGFRPEVKELVYPIVINKSIDQTLWDVDGNKYIDMLCGFGSNFFGNGNEKIKKYVLEQVEKGYEIGPQHELTGEVSELVCELTNSDRAAFCNTGSEAVLGAIRIARTVTGRDTIIAFEGSYHGINDEVIVRGTKSGKSLPAAPGITKGAVQNMIILDYGTDEALEQIRELSKDAAAVLVEPVQSRRSDFHPKEFLQEVRKITLENDCALIFDEVITGFRIHPGGAQAYFDVKADLATYGKIVGGGVSIGVIAGKSKYMDALDGGHWQFGDASTPTVGVTYFAGTFVRHPMALACAKGALEIIKEGGVKQLKDLTSKADHFADEINLFCQQVGLPLKMDNFGSLMKPKWKEDIKNGDLLFALMRFYGVHCYDGFPWFVNLAHTDEELQIVIATFKKSVRALQKVGLLPGIAGEDPVFDVPPIDGAILGKDAIGNPAWFIKDPDNPDEYLEIEA